MAISFVGRNVAGATNGGDPSISLTALTGGSGSAPIQGDVFFVCGGIGDAASTELAMSMTSLGYTLVPGTDLVSVDTVTASMGVFYKFMGASPDTTAVFNGQGGSDAACGAIALVFRGVKAVADGGPFDGSTPAIATGQNTMHPNPPSLNHSNAEGIWILIAGVAGHNAGAGTTFTYPTNYVATSQGSADDTGGDVDAGMSYRSSGFSDPEDPGVMTLSGTDNVGYSWAAATMALAPAASAVQLVMTDGGASIALAADGPLALTQHNILAVADARMTLAADNIVLEGVPVSLVVQDALIALAAEGVVLTQHNVLAVQDAAIALVADGVVLTQHNVLAVQDAIITLAADNLDLVTEGGEEGDTFAPGDNFWF
jgi:hypothetical protein